MSLKVPASLIFFLKKNRLENVRFFIPDELMKS